MLNTDLKGIGLNRRREGPKCAATHAPPPSSDQRQPTSAPKVDAPVYNSRIIDNYIKLLKFKYPWVDATAVLHYARMTSYEVADQGHWFTQRQINRFHEKLSELTQNENIASTAWA